MKDPVQPGARSEKARQAAWESFWRTGSISSYLIYRGYAAEKGRRNAYASVDRRTDC